MNPLARPKPLFVHLAMSVTMLLWGGSFVASKYVLDRIPPLSYMAVRFLIAGLLLVPVIVLRGRPRFSRRTHLLVALTALSEPVAYFLFESYGIRLVTATTASLVIATVPLAVMVTAALTLGEPMHRRGLLAVAVSLSGIVLLVIGADPGGGGAAGSSDGSQLLGIILMFGAVFAAAGYITLARSITQTEDSVHVTIVQTWWGAAVFLLLFLFQRRPLATLEPLDSAGWAALLFLALGATVAAFLLYNWALRHETAGRASLYINAIPVVTALLGRLLLGERLAPIQWAGAALVVIAVRLAVRREPAARAGAVPPLA